MQDRINILNELRNAEAVILLNADNKNYYYLPEGYFNNLANDILSNIFINSLPALNPYLVPENYFNNLPELILEKINSTLSTKKNLYTVPQGYFDTFSDEILSKVKSSEVKLELEQISPFLSSISKTNVYSVPNNYFQQTDPVQVITIDKQPAKVISLGKKAGGWLKYAVAACVAAILFGGGGYLYFSGSPAKTTKVSALATMDVQKEISGLSDDEIRNYLKGNNSISAFTTVEPDDSQLQNIDIQNMLQNVSDDEIQQYLKNDPESAETGEVFKMKKMKKIYLLLLFLFFHSYFCQSQSPDGNDANRVEVIKMAYITHELNLTPQEAQSFWPTYNNYVNEIKQARNQNPNDEVAFEKKAVEIKERYQNNFKKILGNKQRANKVYTTDKQFNNALNNELKNRQQKRLQNDDHQQPQQKQLQQPHSNGNNKKNLKKGNGNGKKPHGPF